MRISDWSSDVCPSDLPQRHVERDTAVAGTGVERSADIDADRPDAGIIAQAEARPLAHAGKAGKAAGVKLSCVEDGDDADIADAATRLYGGLGQAAAADGMVVPDLWGHCVIRLAAVRAA